VRQRTRVPGSAAKLTFRFHFDVERRGVRVPPELQALHLLAQQCEKVHRGQREPDGSTEQQQLLEVVLEGIDLPKHGLEVGFDFGRVARTAESHLGLEPHSERVVTDIVGDLVDEVFQRRLGRMRHHLYASTAFA
jgi:hypothetical protein